MPLIECYRRIGIIGITQAGKTAFLTSLISNMQNPGSKPFRLNGRAIESFRHLGEKADWDVFKYAMHRRHLAERQAWPRKTQAVSEYRCHLRFGRNRLRGWLDGNGKTHLTVLDLPGERFTDFPMVNRDYAAWSDHVVTALRGETWGDEYLATIEQDGLGAEAAADAYRLCLGRMCLNGVTDTSPSTFVVDTAGRYLTQGLSGLTDAEALASARVSGLDAARQFAPLPPAVRAAKPDIAKQFIAHYDAYKTAVVMPLARHFHDCDSLIVLVDAAAILANGDRHYRACEEMIRSLLRYAAPGQTAVTGALNRLTRFASAGHWRWPFASRVRRIAFVASQVDKTHHADWDKLTGLVHDLVSPLLDAMPDRQALDVGYFCCAAINSSMSLEYPKISVPAGPEGGRVVVEPSPVPNRWPVSWGPRQFSYPQFEPDPSVKGRDSEPLNHANLDEVLSYAME